MYLGFVFRSYGYQIHRQPVKFTEGRQKKRRSSSLFEQVAVNIKFYRVKMGISQERMQDETGLAISRHESGRYDMTLTTVDIISKYFGIKPCDLLK